MPRSTFISDKLNKCRFVTFINIVRTISLIMSPKIKAHDQINNLPQLNRSLHQPQQKPFVQTVQAAVVSPVWAEPRLMQVLRQERLMKASEKLEEQGVALYQTQAMSDRQIAFHHAALLLFLYGYKNFTTLRTQNYVRLSE